MTENNQTVEIVETENHPQKNITFKKVLSILGKSTYYVIFGAVILLLVINVYSLVAAKVFKQQVPKVFGYAYQLVLTDSMKGTASDSFPGRTLIVIKEQEEYKVGDVVNFFSAKFDAPITHRIIGEKEGKFITKGDYNNIEDTELLDESNIHGKVIWHSEYLGKILHYVRSPLGIIILLSVGAVLLFLPNTFSNKKQYSPKH